ncbi:hypothetical protein ABZX90_05975 [Streptomyces sp. NPDC002935]|uniref:hypothetical protein n=1 Tax=unclassified Streptomyces TaxID=2593676 RepID=UPI00332A4311
MNMRVQPDADGPVGPAGPPAQTDGDLGTSRGTGPDDGHPTVQRPHEGHSTEPGTDEVRLTDARSDPSGARGHKGTRPGAASAPEPRSTPHPLRVESLRGFAPWAGAGLLLALAWAVAAKSAEWQGSWGETTEMLSTAAAMIGVPFALAAGSWQGGRERRLRMTELRSSTARTPLVQLLVAALPLAGWLAAAYLLVAAGVLIACAPYASAGGPAPTVYAGNALSLAACAVLGHTAGRAVSFRLTAPLLAIGGYLVAGVLGTQRSDLRYLAFCAVHILGDENLAVWWYPLVSALWAAGLAAAAVLALTAYRRATALLPLAAALGAAVLLVQTGDGLLRDNPLAHHQVCDTSAAPDICVNATYPGMLPEVTRALSGLTGRLEGVRNLPVLYEDLRRSPRRNEAQLPNLTPFGWSAVRAEVTDPERYAWEAAHALVRWDCPASPPAQRVQVTDEAVLRWLAPDSLSEDLRRRFMARARQQGDTKELARYRAEDRAYAHLTAMTDDERRSWLGRYFATADQCDPKPSEVPSL